jgi:formylglycine-generating enzyme required for sulfatase activity
MLVVLSVHAAFAGPSPDSAIVGEWDWREGILTVAPGGKFTHANGDGGTWSTLPDPRTYQLAWDNSYVDRVVVSEDGRTIAGTNNHGRSFTAQRRGPAQGTAPPSAQVPGEPQQHTIAAAQSVAATPAPADGQPWTVPDLGLELVWVAPGGFEMGSNDGDGNEKPVHAVQISRGYWLGKYEVTQAEYETMMGTNPSKFRGARNPVESVTFDAAMTFCTKLTGREQKAGRLPEGYEYRLPTEAEWEYAARGSQASNGYTYAGSNTVDEVAWYKDNGGGTTRPVGLKKSNELGLYDMSGNVWDWCLDGYDESYYAKSPSTDPVNLQAGTGHVGRGGSWGDVARIVRSTRRGGSRPGIADGNLGFRACLAPAIATKQPTAPVLGREERSAGADTPESVMHAVVVVEGDAGVGSGFVTVMFGKTVVVTNAHVLVGSRSIRVTDLRGNRLRFGPVCLGRSSDVALIPLLEWKEPVLTVEESVERAVELGAPVAAYGNSRGEGVITRSDGKVNGIGPEKVEVTAEFVEGNSGGPIVATTSGRVVAVATYISRTAASWVTAGTRFERVRRFGLRLDNLQPADFQEVNEVAYNADLKRYRQLEYCNQQAILFLKDLVEYGRVRPANLDDPKLKDLAALLNRDLANAEGTPGGALATALGYRLGQLESYVSWPFRGGRTRMSYGFMDQMYDEEVELNRTVRDAITTARTGLAELRRGR